MAKLPEKQDDAGAVAENAAPPQSGSQTAPSRSRRWSKAARPFLRPLRAVPALWLFAALVMGAMPDGYFQVTRNWLFDNYQRLSPAQRPNSKITIIAIDDESLHRVGQWPWGRDVLARIVDAASAADVLGIDLILAEPDRLSPPVWAATRTDLSPALRQSLAALPSTDEILARSLASVPVILSVVAQPASRVSAAVPGQRLPLTPVEVSGPDPVRHLPPFKGLMAPLPILARAVHGLGVASVPLEFDGVMRRAPIVFDVDGVPMPSFAAEIVQTETHSGPIRVQGDPGGIAALTVDGKRLPTDLEGRIWPRYARDPAGVTVPAWQVIEGLADPAIFRGRIVLIGATAAGLSDIVVTPLRRSAPGVTVHAQLIESILAGDGLWRPPAMGVFELAISFLLGILALILPERVGVLRYGILFAGLAAALMLCSFLLFMTAGFLLDWTFPITAIGGTALLVLAARTREEVIKRREHEKELASALMSAEAADRSKTEFLATVSHELRTPLSAVIGFSEVMTQQIMGPLSPVYAGYANDIHRSGRHLLSIIDDILDLSVLELGGARARADLVDLGATLNECRRMVIPRAEIRNVSLVLQIEPRMPALRADARMFKQMVINLLSNAVKYAPKGSEVGLRSTVNAGWLAISVSDRGPGIAIADLAKVTQRFGRLQSARLAQEPGLGIGLALTKSMIELHGGRLEIRSAIGVGTEALLWFPPETVVAEDGR